MLPNYFHNYINVIINIVLYFVIYLYSVHMDLYMSNDKIGLQPTHVLNSQD